MGAKWMVVAVAVLALTAASTTSASNDVNGWYSSDVDDMWESADWMGSSDIFVVSSEAPAPVASSAPPAVASSAPPAVASSAPPAVASSAPAPAPSSAVPETPQVIEGVVEFLPADGSSESITFVLNLDCNQFLDDAIVADSIVSFKEGMVDVIDDGIETFKLDVASPTTDDIIVTDVRCGSVIISWYLRGDDAANSLLDTTAVADFFETIQNEANLGLGDDLATYIGSFYAPALQLTSFELEDTPVGPMPQSLIPTPTSPVTPPVSVGDESSGLSDGEIAGAVVGSLALAGLLGGAAYMGLRHKQRTGRLTINGKGGCASGEAGQQQAEAQDSVAVEVGTGEGESKQGWN